MEEKWLVIGNDTILRADKIWAVTKRSNELSIDLFAENTEFRLQFENGEEMEATFAGMRGMFIGS